MAVRELTPTKARAVATAAYLFAYPLVIRYREMYRQAIDPSSPTFSGGFGTWRRVAVRESRQAGTGRPQLDVVYSSIWLDLRSEPWWCTVGDVSSDVSFTGRWVDLWGFTLETESTDRPTRSGSVLASAPKRVHQVPAEIDGIVRGESGFISLLTETRWRDPFALPGASPVEPEILLEPVSVHSGRSTPKPPRVIHWWPPYDGIETTDDFWPCANFALTLITPNPLDESLLLRIAEIGVGAGRRWEASMFSDAVLDAIHAGVDDALGDLLEGAGEPARSKRHHVRRSEMDNDYFGRALQALRRLP